MSLSQEKRLKMQRAKKLLQKDKGYELPPLPKDGAKYITLTAKDALKNIPTGKTFSIVE